MQENKEYFLKGFYDQLDKDICGQIRKLSSDGRLQNRRRYFPKAIQNRRLEGTKRRVIYVRKYHCNLSLPPP